MRVLLCCLLLVIAGCKTYPSGEKPPDLVYKTSAFEDTVRWGDLEKMVLFLEPGEAKTAVAEPGLDNVRVTGYELAGTLTKISDTRWMQTAVIHYVLTDWQVVRRLVDEQVWLSDDEGKTWYRTTPPPVFR